MTPKSPLIDPPPFPLATPPLVATTADLSDWFNWPHDALVYSIETLACTADFWRRSFYPGIAGGTVFYNVTHEGLAALLASLSAAPDCAQSAYHLFHSLDTARVPVALSSSPQNQPMDRLAQCFSPSGFGKVHA